MIKSSKDIKGKVYRSIHEYVNSENYMRAIALGFTDFTYSFDDPDLESIGVLSVEVHLKNSVIDIDYELSSLVFTCSTLIFDGSQPLFYVNYDERVKIDINIVEVSDRHNTKLLYINTSLYNINFKVDMHSIDTVIMTPILISKFNMKKLKQLSDCGLDKRPLNFVWDIENKASVIDNINYMYYNYKGGVNLYVKLDSIKTSLLHAIFSYLLAIGLDCNKKKSGKFNLILVSESNEHVEESIYSRLLVDDLIGLYKIFDDVTISYKSSVYIDSAF